MKRILCTILLIQGSLIMAQTKTVVTPNGEKVTIHPNVNNGLTASGGNIQLGGDLTKPTTITTTAVNTLSLVGLQTGAVTDYLVVTDATGVIKKIAISSLPAPTFTVSNNSSGNTLSTTVNGTTGATVPIVNTNTLSVSNGSLTSSVNGKTSSPPVPIITTANNGLTATAGNVQLGGTLIKPTYLTTSAANTLSITGLQAGNETDKVLVASPSTGYALKSLFLNDYAWLLGGNKYVSGKSYTIGTKDNYPFVFITGGNERMRIGTNGGVAIGTTDTSTYALNICSSTNTYLNGSMSISEYNDYSYGGAILQFARARGSWISSTVPLDGDVLGMLKFNALDASNVSTTNASLTVTKNGSSANFNFSGSDATGANTLFINTATAMVGIKTTNPTQALDVAGSIKASGTITPSDARFKTDIRTINNGLDKISHLRGVTYNYDIAKFPEKGFSAGKQYGVIAQELEKVLPELVITDNEGYKAVNYQGIIPVLMEALKEQQEQIKKDREKIKALEELLSKR